MNNIADVHFACNSRKLFTRFFFPPERKMQQDVSAFGITVAKVVIDGIKNYPVHQKATNQEPDKEPEKNIFIVRKKQFAHIRFDGC